mmetsp:Transcript_66234/g.141752  ORF Transcript_66234/g.141752 Transcript_66234/m.141752 type:complete len:98 (+) Transcript_66234:1-294(+)
MQSTDTSTRGSAQASSEPPVEPAEPEPDAAAEPTAAATFAAAAVAASAIAATKLHRGPLAGITVLLRVPLKAINGSIYLCLMKSSRNIESWEPRGSN